MAIESCTGRHHSDSRVNRRLEEKPGRINAEVMEYNGHRRCVMISSRGYDKFPKADLD